MTKKRIFIVIGLLITLGVAGLTLGKMLPARRGVTEANYDLVKSGMTREDVQEIFGIPPKVVSRISDLRDDVEWEDNNGSARITFLYDRSIKMGWSDGPETVYQKLRRRLYFRLH